MLSVAENGRGAQKLYASKALAECCWLTIFSHPSDFAPDSQITLPVSVRRFGPGAKVALPIAPGRSLRLSDLELLRYDHQIGSLHELT